MYIDLNSSTLQNHHAMRALITLLLCVASSLATFAQEVSAKQRLIEAYHALCQQPHDSARQVAFFEAYPATYSEVQVCFGYNRFQKPDLDYVAYSQAFDQLSYISDSQKITRLFNMLVGGYWQADGHSMHFMFLKNRMINNPEQAFAIIAKESIQRQTLFWQYYWQNPCMDPSLAREYNLYYTIKGYKAEKKIMKQAYDLFRGELPVLDEL